MSIQVNVDENALAGIREIARMELASVLAKSSTEVGRMLTDLLFGTTKGKPYPGGDKSQFSTLMQTAAKDVIKQKIQEWCERNEGRINATIAGAVDEMLSSKEFKELVQDHVKASFQLRRLKSAKSVEDDDEDIY